MTTAFKFARSLSLAEWLYVADAWFTTARTNMETRWRGYSTWRVNLLDAMTQEQLSSNTNKDNVYRLRKIFNGALRLQFLPVNCLRRSLALHHFLQRRDIQTRLRIGTKIIDGKLHGHAWLEYAGEVLNDQDYVLSEYTPFSSENLQQIAIFE